MKQDKRTYYIQSYKDKNFNKLLAETTKLDNSEVTYLKHICKKQKCQSRILYLAKIHFKNEGKIDFSDK